ncbi:MAG TPA: DUF1549 domain-containing protein, partial [Verrucomicrobiae bacterium]|nr:DUF1549 domain-containing protein [Verrucomicrobiae bacterium]
FFQAVARLDQAFAGSWENLCLKPASRTSDLTLARRLSLALTGTIPSLEEVRALESLPEAQRVQWWLTHLFEDRRYGDYLAERFARMAVGVENGPFIIYRRHRLVSWFSDQLMANRPYDELVRELISAEGVWTSKPAANFVTVTVDQNNEAEGPDQIKLAGRVSKAFLGVRLDCVECHDDFMGDRWQQTDFHQLAAFFAQSEMSMTGVRDNPERTHDYRYLGKREVEPVPARVPFHEDLLPPEGQLRERLAAWVTHPDNRPFARTLVNRVWALLFNQPLHEPVDSIPIEGPFPPGLEVLADDLIAHNFDLQRLIRVIAASQAFQSDSRSDDAEHPVTTEQSQAFAAFPITRLRPEQVAGSVLQSANLKTIDANSHVLVRIVRFFQQNDFIKRYGDAGEDEFGVTGGTIPQRLVLMNGKLVHERTKEDLVMNSATRIGAVAPDNATAVETAYLTVLTRRPTPDEREHFVERLENGAGVKRSELMEDLFWTLINSTEFSWNH